ncbi:HpcH/HpaI aldolase/citrate lyase family protein [Blastococcus sp. SYSU D00820]
MAPATVADGHEVVRSARSLLFVPGHRPDRFGKAARSGADLVVLDLEDAVPADRKDLAREEAAAWMANGGRACVRINDAAHPVHRSDVAALAGLPGLLAVMLAKADDPAQVAGVAVTAGVPVIALVESALGVARSAEIAAAPGVARLAFGHLDFALDIGAEPTSRSMLHARSTLVLSSAAAGLPGPLDGVTTNLDDPDVLRTDVAHARSLGMRGKLLIHPRQVAPAHAAMRPGDEEIRWAVRIVEAVDGPEAARIDGHMVDAPVLARARTVLRDADRDAPVG